MAAVSEIITQGIGTPSGVPYFLLLGLGPNAVVPYSEIVGLAAIISRQHVDTAAVRQRAAWAVAVAQSHQDNAAVLRRYTGVAAVTRLLTADVEVGD